MSRYTNAITPIKMSSYNYDTQLIATDTSQWVTIDINSSATGGTDTGTYVDMDGLEGDKMIILGQFLPTTETIQVTLKGGSYSAGNQGTDGGDVSVTLHTGAKKYSIDVNYMNGQTDTEQVGTIGIAGPFETARFKDTDGYIKILGGGTGCSATALTAKIATIIVG